jgi:arylsulfatase A-like enzyme
VVFRQPPRRVDLRNHYNWWAYVPGANWRHPEGPGSTLHGRERHPVVHVAYEDVAAYASDEFFGNLYHLNAEEEPELPDYPPADGFPDFRERFGPRGVIRTHPKPESRGQAGRWQSEYHDTMIDHDKVVGTLLDKLDEFDIAENTIVLYSTDNGPHMNSWPDAAMTPFRNEKNSNWEGAFRVPAMIRWPGKIASGAVSNEIVSHLDWLPTFLAAAGDPLRAPKLFNLRTDPRARLDDREHAR